MKSNRKITKLVTMGCALLAVAGIALGLMILRQFEEFGRVEAVKGYWASLVTFRNQFGRYPKGSAEISEFFKTDADIAPVEYVEPSDDDADETILWWKDRTRFGVMVGITESGDIVKK
jgi:hypothetical protein